MTLNDLLTGKLLNPQHVLVLRHRPSEPELNKVLPWLAAERPTVFNAYQQTQGGRLEGVMDGMAGTGHVASFIGHEPGKALFVGVYHIASSKPITHKQFWKIPAYIEMKAFGMKGWYVDEKDRPTVLWFDLVPTPFYADWKGKLVIHWPPPERAWWRRAHNNEMPVLAIHEDSVLDSSMPAWDEIVLTWEELGVLPTRWKASLSQWRGIYFIHDASDGKGYVGSAYGGANLLGRWLNYAALGHGGNKLLRQRNPLNFRFSILQRVSPDMDVGDMTRLESTCQLRNETGPFSRGGSSQSAQV